MAKIRDEFQGLVEHLHEKVKANMLRDGNLMPVVFLLSREGMGIIGGEFGNREEKEHFAKEVRRIAQENHAIGAIFASESWILEVKKGDEGFDNPTGFGEISENPKRKEVVVIMEEYLDECYMTGYEIIRDKKGEVVELKKGMSESSGRGDLGGTFMNLLGKPSGDELMAELIERTGKGK